MSGSTEAAWTSVELDLGEIVPSKADRARIWQKIVDIRTAERIEFSGKLLTCQDRLDAILDGSFDDLVAAKRARSGR